MNTKLPVRILALLLCAAMLCGMVGCGTEPVPTEIPTLAPTEPPVTEPSAESLFAKACANLENAGDVTLRIESTKTTTVSGTVLTEETEQTLARSGDSFHSLTEVTYDGISYTFEDLLFGGVHYTSVDEEYHFRSINPPEELIPGQYPPSIPVDASLYGSVTADGNTISFADPSDAESWAVPEDAELVDASASVLLDSEGTPEHVSYSVTYDYGPTQVSLDVQIDYTSGAQIPEPDLSIEYQNLDNPHLPRLAVRAFEYLIQCDDVTTSSQETIVSQAAAVMRNQSLTMNLSNSDDLAAKIDTHISFMDYTTNKSEAWEQEELFRNGKYSYSEDGGKATTVPGVTESTITDYCLDQILSHFIYMDQWEDATLSALSSTYFVEFDFLDTYGEDIQGYICNLFWEDANFLNNLSTGKGVTNVSGYLAVDKYSGLPTAAGYSYEGYHTIDRINYGLTFQTDQAIIAPAKSTWFNITGEMPPEEEPESKATPLLYHVTGEEGQEMWLFGTIHVGDQRTAYLPQEIYDAFAASDALALEFHADTFEKQVEEDKAIQNAVSECYYYSDGSTPKDHLDEELYEEAIKHLKASGGYSLVSSMIKPSFWSSTIENFLLQQGYQLTAEQGCESRLEKLAKDQNKAVLDVESGLFQMQMTAGWSDELQELLLEESISYDSWEFCESTWELYEMWCAGDEAALREAISDEVDTSELTEEELAEYEEQKHLLDEYNQAMSYDRNDNMLEVAKGYLESGDVVFFAVGLAHLLNNVNGLVDTLQAAGYTVEPVSYS